jgi:ubiquinone/menaquinone biosynthesis C-methylase UbiE
MDAETDFFSPAKGVIEVAPVRSFQAYCLARKQGKDYVSFDLEKFGMEKGDITAMRYADSSCDYFLCFHVLEHVPKDTLALKEIFRVLRPGGLAVLQVPIDCSLSDTVEYGQPNPFETGHVRRYSDSGFTSRIAQSGFTVRKVRAQDLFSQEDIRRFGMNMEPVFFATKPS